jgi:hypothetical protein
MVENEGPQAQPFRLSSVFSHHFKAMLHKGQEVLATSPSTGIHGEIALGILGIKDGNHGKVYKILEIIELQLLLYLPCLRNRKLVLVFLDLKISLHQQSLFFFFGSSSSLFQLLFMLFPLHAFISSRMCIPNNIAFQIQASLHL